MTLDVFIEKPDATKQISLKCEDVQWQGVGDVTVRDMPAKATIFVDPGKRLRTFTLVGLITGQLGETAKLTREDLDDAFQNWWNVSDGRSRLKWGTKNDGTDYDFKVVFKSVTIHWTSRAPGTAAKLLMQFTITLQEVGVIGALN